MHVDPGLPRVPGVTGGVSLDPVVCALAIKAATTKRAVATLCEQGDGDNALALTRVLLENACLLEWLMRGEGRQRLESFVMFTSVVHERIVATLRRFKERFVAAGGDFQITSDPFHRAVANHVFGNPKSDRPTWKFERWTTKNRHPVTVRQMFEEIAEGPLSFEYEVLYGALGSDIVHSGPFSLARILGTLLKRSTFALEPSPVSEPRTIALAISNTAMLLVLESLNGYAGLGMEEDIAELKAQSHNDPVAPAPKPE